MWPSAPPRCASKVSVPYIDISGLRGLAALLVLVRHINVRDYLCDYRGLEELGVFSVGAFFVLSSFLLSVRRLPFPTKIPQLFHASAHKIALSFRALRDDIPLWGHPHAQFGLRHWILSTRSRAPQPVIPGYCRARHIGLEVLRPTQYWIKYIVRRFFRV
jgi:hypothetical protein